MPDGEVLKGKDSGVNSDSVGFSFGSATAFGGGTSATAFGNLPALRNGPPSPTLIRKQRMP